MNYKQNLLEKIENKTAVIGVIGLGYVGLPLALLFAEKNYNVIGFDIDEKKIPVLMSGQSYIKHIPGLRIKTSVKNKKFLATTDFSLLNDCDSILICVPTPLNDNNEPEMKYVVESAKVVAQYIRPGQLIVLESSTYPGTTEELLLPMFEKALYRMQSSEFRMKNGVREIKSEDEELKDNNINNVGEDFFLAFSPEREDPNNPEYNTETIPKIVGGITRNCLEAACSLYNHAVMHVVPVSSSRVAEAAKLLENIYRSINVALVNELKMVFAKMNIDIWEVIEAAKTKPFGFHAFYPGPGLGGHCIPIDPFYLTWKARQYGIETKFIELAGEINTYQPYYAALNVADALSKKNKEIKRSKILILGVAYKKNVDDMRESPSLKLIEILEEQGAHVDYSDPFIPKLPATRKYKFEKESVDITLTNLSTYDLVLLSTDHDSFDYDFISQHSGIIIDTRNAFGSRGILSERIVKS